MSDAEPIPTSPDAPAPEQNCEQVDQHEGELTALQFAHRVIGPTAEVFLYEDQQQRTAALYTAQKFLDASTAGRRGGIGGAIGGGPPVLTPGAYVVMAEYILHGQAVDEDPPRIRPVRH